MAKLLAVPIGSLAGMLVEYGLVVAPKHVDWIRRRLDQRAVFEGVWLQNVKNMAPEAVGEDANRFAVFGVTHVKGRYVVEGVAYDPIGRENSRWQSTDALHFSPDARSMIYMWEGTAMTQGGGQKILDRRGFCQIDLSTKDSGTGRVEHVAMPKVLIFNMVRVTQELVDRWRPGRSVDFLRSQEERDSFALSYAKSLTAKDKGSDP